MTYQLKNKILVELAWLFGIVAVSAAIEYSIIMLFDLHPILSLKIQALIGLVVIAYVIRMISRMGNQGLITFVDEDEETEKSEQQSQPN